MDHVVQRGETLRRIADQYETTIAAVIAANPDLGDPDLIRPGQRLTIPPNQPPPEPARIAEADAASADPPANPLPDVWTYEVQSGDTMRKIADQLGTTLTELIAANPGVDPDHLSLRQRLVIPRKQPPAPTPQPAPEPVSTAPPKPAKASRSYEVQPGDSMKKIAGRHDVTLSEIIAANPQIPDPNALRPGDMLIIPAATITSPATTTTPPPRPQPVGPDGDWSKVPTRQRILYVMERLIDYGYGINGAAGIVGNLFYESGVLPNRIERSAPDSPMRSKNFAGVPTDFTAEEVMRRSPKEQRGPQKAGIGLAQWTSKGRRRRLFEHEYQGRVAGPDILTDMDAQIDYLVLELRTRYKKVEKVVARRKVRLKDATDEVLYNFEIPGSVIGTTGKLPREDPAVQEVFAKRRKYARRARRLYKRAYPPDQ